jgi:ribosomal 30S subunit maturation factor RimM
MGLLKKLFGDYSSKEIKRIRPLVDRVLSYDEEYGKLTDVVNHGASDIYEITRPDGTKALVPVVDEFVSRVLPGEGIYLTPIEGLI